MNRTVLSLASIAVIALGVSVAVAQQDVVKERKGLMKANGKEVKIALATIKDQRPYDEAAVKKIFATFENAAEKMPGLFPESSKSEAGSLAADKFSPTAKVWEDMADFKARFAKLGRDAKAAAASVKSVATLKAAMGNIGKNDCAACHKLYRAKNG
jgi:cytochrome c556